jgi:rubredoxin
MSLPATVVTYAECPLCGYRSATVLIDRWTTVFLRCQRCEHIWSEDKPEPDK